MSRSSRGTRPRYPCDEAEKWREPLEYWTVIASCGCGGGFASAGGGVDVGDADAHPLGEANHRSGMATNEALILLLQSQLSRTAQRLMMATTDMPMLRLHVLVRRDRPDTDADAAPGMTGQPYVQDGAWICLYVI